MTSKKKEVSDDMNAKLREMFDDNNKYLLVNITAKRARKLMEGVRPLVPFETFDPIDIADEETKKKLLKIEEKKKNSNND